MKDNLVKIEQYIKDLNYYTSHYDKGEPLISDTEWDRMYFELVKLENETGIYLPNSPTQTIVSEKVSALKTVKHNHAMLSLDKTKDWSMFLRYFTALDASKSVIGMVKLDGLTCSLRYVGGELVSAETRGNGQEGEDILHNARVVRNIPKRIVYTDELIIDGEIISTKEDFEPFSNDYANQRNFAAGSIRLLDASECQKRNLKFVAWNVVKGLDGTSHLKNLVSLETFGFTVVPWTSSFDWDTKEFLIDQAKKLGYPIDGLVGRFDDIDYGVSLGSTGHHSRAAFAFKFADEEYETELLDIEWSMGRTGVLTPVAIFAPIDDGESVIERASLHNLSILESLLTIPYYGQKIKVFKANMIIPQISWGEGWEVGVDHTPIPLPAVCPICGAPTEKVTEVDSTVLKCTGAECPAKLITRLDHFAGKKGLDIKGLSHATLEKFIDWGWVASAADLYTLAMRAKEWKAKPGFGEKSVEKILDAIEASRYPTLEAFISALGIPGVGRTLSKEIAKFFNSYEEFRNAVRSKWDFTRIDKIGYEITINILTFDFTEADRVDAYMLAYSAPEGTVSADQTLANHKIAITGSLNRVKNRNELQALIEAHGGKVVTSVTKNTTLLVNNDIKSTSSKNVSAERLGIPILTEDEFWNLYLEN